MWAAEIGHTEVVKALIEKGADVNAKDQVRCWVDCFVGLNRDTLSVQQQDSAAGADIQSHLATPACLFV
jgi:ankyrin repeat protein